MFTLVYQWKLHILLPVHLFHTNDNFTKCAIYIYFSAYTKHALHMPYNFVLQNILSQKPNTTNMPQLVCLHEYPKLSTVGQQICTVAWYVMLVRYGKMVRQQLMFSVTYITLLGNKMFGLLKLVWYLRDFLGVCMLKALYNFIPIFG